MVPVVSSNIDSLGWEPGPPPWVGTLGIVFRSGARYLYRGVPALVAFRITMGEKDGSVGKTFWELVRRADYPYERLD